LRERLDQNPAGIAAPIEALLAFGS
jgi:hypothetical protein